VRDNLFALIITITITIIVIKEKKNGHEYDG